MNENINRQFKCDWRAYGFRILGIILSILAIAVHYVTNISCQFSSAIIVPFFFTIVGINFQYAIPLEIKTSQEGLIVRRWKKEKRYPWGDIEISWLIRLLGPSAGLFDLHLLSEPFYKRRLMILGLNLKKRKELLEIIKAMTMPSLSK